MASAPAPLFRDPIYDGAADPTIIWNQEERTWGLLYTARRATVPSRGVAWVHGTDIGIASSADGGQSWRYRGTLQNLAFQPGHNTFWAPEVLWHEGLYHMYVSYVHGIPHDWSGERHIIHYTSVDLWNWTLQSVLDLSSNRVIDACVHHLPDGRWRLWYKDEVNHSHTYAADSDDLYQWRLAGPIITDCAHEGPNVFHWQESYWMLTDPWRGLGVYRSDDGEQWQRQENILDKPGTREDDGTTGRHADVLVQGENAYVFYFTHPGRPDGLPRADSAVFPDRSVPYAYKRSSLQVARLEIVDGALICNRDHPFDFHLQDGP